MRLGRRASLQRQFDGGEHGLFVMLEDQGQDPRIKSEDKPRPSRGRRPAF
jgi:hypothetical protein